MSDRIWLENRSKSGYSLGAIDHSAVGAVLLPQEGTGCRLLVQGYIISCPKLEYEKALEMFGFRRDALLKQNEQSGQPEESK